MNLCVAQNIQADEYNAFLAMASEYRTGRVEARANVQPREIGRDVVRVKNMSGAAVSRFGVLAIDAPRFSPTDNLEEFKNRLYFSGLAPGASTKKHIAVLLEPADVDATALATTTGCVQTIVAVSDAGHAYAVPSSGDTAKLISSADTGFRVVWKESGTGDCWAIVDLDDWIEKVVVPTPELIVATVANAAGITSSTQDIAADAWEVFGPSGAEWNTEVSVPSSIKNTKGLTLADDDTFLAVRNSTDGTWHALMKWAVVTIQPITAMQLDASNNLQVKTTKVSVLAAETESAWTTVSGWTTTECP